GEEASFFIEPNSWSGGDFANLFLGNFYHGITADTNQGLHFLSQKNYLFGAGNVGLGVEEPKAKLHVDGDILFESAMQGFVMKSEDGHCWKGIISNTGILEFQQVDCTTFTMSEETPETEHNGVFVYPNPSNGSFVVEYTGNKNELRLEVTSVNGALLGTYPIQKGKNTIALPEISQQLVVVTAYTTRGKLVSAHKIMVSR
ncbi:MAG: T9SS type A sorting domain-containing protein, partial [Bacteroidetes bacterium]|nr:T9SS type A sorting domain-containing protein [Bacteroidota bacterium]